MGTDKIKLQAYVQPELYQLFLSWKQERGIESNSLAFDELLADYFGKPQPKSEISIDEEKIRAIVEEEMKRAIAQLTQRIEVLEGNQKPAKAASAFLSPLSGSELAKRLGTDPATLIKNRIKENFEVWTKNKDPQWVKWKYDKGTKKYNPFL
jgi:hypothetical protein